VVAAGAAGAAEAGAGAPPEEMTNAIDAQAVASSTKTTRILLKLSPFELTNAACNRRGQEEFPSTPCFRSTYDIGARDTPTSRFERSWVQRLQVSVRDGSQHGE
jgi:hypothetical protein